MNRDLFLSCALYVSLCFSSLLGFISSLPQLETKGYVVVVVVVVRVDRLDIGHVDAK
jgi:hypothetical protein